MAMQELPGEMTKHPTPATGGHVHQQSPKSLGYLSKKSHETENLTCLKDGAGGGGGGVILDQPMTAGERVNVRHKNLDNGFPRPLEYLR